MKSLQRHGRKNYFNLKVLGEILKAKKQKGENELVKIVSVVMPMLIK